MFSQNLRIITISWLLVACNNPQTNACNAPETIKHLRLDYGYEIASNPALPQMQYYDVQLLREMDSMVWCKATASVHGNGKELTDLLIAKLGRRNWQEKKATLQHTDISLLSPAKIHSLVPYLTVFYLQKYQANLPPDHDYQISMQVTYAVNKQSNYLTSVDYSKDVFQEVSQHLRTDLSVSQEDAKLLQVMHN